MNKINWPDLKIPPINLYVMPKRWSMQDFDLKAVSLAEIKISSLKSKYPSCINPTYR